MSVVATHLKVPLIGLNDTDNGLLMHGAAGVDIFFVLSGFVMAHTSLDRQITPLAFMRARFSRIAPLYWAMTVFVFIAGCLKPTLFPHLPVDTRHLLTSIFFIPQPEGQLVYVGWTLNYEMFFYLIFAMFLHMKGRMKRATCIIGTLIALAACHFLTYGNFIAHYLCNPIILEFVAGIVISLIWRSTPTPGSMTIYVFLCMAAYTALFLGPNPLNSVHSYSRLLQWGPPAAVLVLAAVLLERNGIIIKDKFIQLLGDASYSIYLTHVFVTRAYEKFPKLINLEQNQHIAYAYSLIVMLITAAIGVAVYRWLEMPLTQRVQTLLGKTHSIPMNKAAKPEADPT